MRIQSIRSFAVNYWQAGVSTLAGTAFAVALLGYRLGSLIPRASASEYATLHANHSLHAILLDPFFAPYKVGLYALSSLHHLTLFSGRLLSAIFGFATALCLFYILNHWYDLRSAIVGTFLLITSSWFLTYARLATPLISYSLIVACVTYGVWVRNAKRPGLILGFGAALAAGLIYTPGLIWFAIFAIIWQRKTALRQFALAPKLAITVGAIFVLTLAPLIYALYFEPSLIRTLFGLSASPLSQLKQFPHQIIHIINELIWHGHGDAATGLVGLALIDFFIGIMAILGTCSYILHYKLDRTKMLVGSGVLGVILVALRGPLNSVILLPLIYLLASAGIAYMLQVWFAVFPRNPLARSLGVGLIITAVLLAGFYQTQRYFVAWPMAPETKQAFTIQL